MNENNDRSNRVPGGAAFKKLADHLAVLNSQDGSISPLETDMLSLLVSGALRGEEISKRYPDLYRKLLANAELRQAFIDALESVEAERAGQLVPLPQTTRTNLAFLRKQLTAPVLEISESGGWRASWQRTLEQIQAIFSPQQLVYRTGTIPTEEPWFILLRDEITIAGIVYAVALDCTLSNDLDNALSTFLSIAVTVGGSSEPAQFPVRANLQWGAYQESILVPEEGRARFPDIPLSTIYGPEKDQIQAGISLKIETVS